MADNDITSISISAKANTTDATAQIKALATQLERLQKVTQSGIGAETGAALRNLATAMNSLNGTNISANLPRQFAALGRSLNAFGASLNSFDVGRLREVRDALRDMADAQGGMQTINRFGDIAATPTQATGVLPQDVQTTENLATANTELTASLEQLNSTLEKLSNSLSKTSGRTKDSEKAIKNIGKAASSSTSKLGQLWAAMKRIAMYRAMRTAIKMVTQAFREGIQNLYQYSALINGTFKQSMDTLATSALYLKNSLGAMVAPIINALAPAIDILVDKFVDLLNIFNQFLAMITGASTWTKALKYPKEYAENMERAGGAAKELRATLLGFDEINRLDDLQARGGGGGTPGMDYSKMFEEVPLIKKSLSDMWDDFLESGKNKFSLWAAGLAGILALKLSGTWGGIFGGAAGSASLFNSFTATLLAAFAGFRLGNWLYYNNVGGVRDIADDLMDAGLGESIMKFQTSVTEGWDLMYDKAVEWGDKVNGFFGGIEDGWGLLYDEAVRWGDKINDWWYEFNDDEYTIVFKYDTPDGWNDLTNGIIDALADAGLMFDGKGYRFSIDYNKPPEYNPNIPGSHLNPTPTPTTPKTTLKDLADSLHKVSKDIEDAAKTVPKVTQNQSYVPTYFTAHEKGGSVQTGDLFLANEKEPELIAHIGNRTQVANNDQITESIRLATQQGNAEGNMLLRQAVAALNGLLAKDTTVEAVVTADSITNGLARQNLRNGRTTVAVG